MRLTRARAADQHSVAAVSQEVALVQVAHHRRVHWRGDQVELGQRLQDRELGVAHAVGRGPALHVGQLRGRLLHADRNGQAELARS